MVDADRSCRQPSRNVLDGCSVLVPIVRWVGLRLRHQLVAAPAKITIRMSIHQHLLHLLDRQDDKVHVRIVPISLACSEEKRASVTSRLRVMHHASCVSHNAGTRQARSQGDGTGTHSNVVFVDQVAFFRHGQKPSVGGTLLPGPEMIAPLKGLEAGADSGAFAVQPSCFRLLVPPSLTVPEIGLHLGPAMQAKTLPQHGCEWIWNHGTGQGPVSRSVSRSVG